MKKVLSIILIIVILLCVFAKGVYALGYTASMTASKQTVPEGSEFIVSVKVQNIDVGNGIDSLSGTIDYDTTVFESINSSSIDSKNGWNAIYNESTKEVRATKLTQVREDEEVFQIVLITKAGTTGKEGKITFSNIKASNSENSGISAGDISTTIKVGVETTPTSSPISIANLVSVTPSPSPISSPALLPENTISNNTISNNTISNNTTAGSVYNNVNKTNTTNITNSNSSSRNIAYAGVEDGIVKLAFGILIIAVLSFWRIHTLRDIK